MWHKSRYIFRWLYRRYKNIFYLKTIINVLNIYFLINFIVKRNKLWICLVLYKFILSYYVNLSYKYKKQLCIYYTSASLQMKFRQIQRKRIRKYKLKIHWIMNIFTLYLKQLLSCIVSHNIKIHFFFHTFHLFLVILLYQEYKTVKQT